MAPPGSHRRLNTRSPAPRMRSGAPRTCASPAPRTCAGPAPRTCTGPAPRAPPLPPPLRAAEPLLPCSLRGCFSRDAAGPSLGVLRGPKPAAALRAVRSLRCSGGTRGRLWVLSVFAGRSQRCRLSSGWRGADHRAGAGIGIAAGSRSHPGMGAGVEHGAGAPTAVAAGVGLRARSLLCPRELGVCQ